ncbi:MAG: hypothetical protein WCR91_05435 [Sphaerochaetaceae bacterium]
MKKIIFLLFTIVSIKMSAQMINGNAYFRMVDPESTSMTDLVYENDSLYFRFYIARDCVGVSVKNKGNNTITIVWDESVLAVNGVSDKSAIIGERKTVGIPSSKIPKNTVLEEVKLTQRNKHTLRNHPAIFTKADFISKKDGMPIFIDIPIEANGTKTEYEFNFSVFKSSQGPIYLRSSNETFIRATKLFHVIESNWSEINSIIANILKEKGTRQKSVVANEIAKIYAEAPNTLFKEAIFNRMINYYQEKKYCEVVSSAICEYYLNKEGKDALTND